MDNIRASIDSAFFRSANSTSGFVSITDVFQYNSVAILILHMFLTWIWIWFHNEAHRRLHNEGPMAWPLFGSSIEMLRNYDHLYDWLLIYFRYTKTVKVPMPLCTYNFTVDPQLVEHVLKTNFSNYPKGKLFHESMEVFLGDGIFNTDGEMWKRQRKTASFQFSSKTLREFSTVVFRQDALRLSDIVLGAADTRKPIEIQDLFLRLTLDSIFKIGFGVELGVLDLSLPDDPFAIAFDTMNAVVTRRFIDPLWKVKRLLNVGYEASVKKNITQLDEFVYKVILRRKSELLSSSLGGKSDRPDLLSRFMVLSKDPANEINDKTLRDIVLNFIMAGRDTTAATLSWFTYLLAIHSDTAEKVFQELKQLELELKGSSKNSLATDHQSLSERVETFAELLNFETLAKLSYLHAALTETLRLYPAVAGDPKEINADDIAPDGSILKRGDLVIYTPYCMGRMEFIWGQDAHQFKPERWLNDGVFEAVSPFKFTAFQAGPRICLGKDSAYLQMKMTAAILCRFTRFELVPGRPVKYRMAPVITIAHGLRVTVTKR